MSHLAGDSATPGIITSIARFYVYYHMRRFLRVPSKMSPYITRHMKEVIRKNLPTRTTWVYKFHQGRENRSTWLSKQPNRRNIRHVRYARNTRGEVAGIRYQEVTKIENASDKDWKRFIHKDSNGLTKTGQLLLQMAVEAYVYSVLGAQAQTHWAIVGDGSNSTQTQAIFSKLVRDTTIADDQAVTIANMRTAITATNVVLNMVISPA